MATGPGDRPVHRVPGARVAVGATAITAGVLGLVASVAGLAGDRDRLGGRSPVPSRGAAVRAPDRRERTTRDPGTGSAGGRTENTKDRTVQQQDERTSERDSPSTRRAKTSVDPDDPRKPEGPEDLKKRSWTYVLKKVFREFGADQCTDLAAALTYRAVLALFPALLAIVSLLGLFGNPQGTTNAVLKVIRHASPATAKTLGPVVSSLTQSSAAPFTFVLGIVLALVSASGYVAGFSRAMNRIYGIDEGRPIWKLRPTQILITIAVVVLVVIGALLLASTGTAGTIGTALGIGPTAVLIFNIVKWPVLLVIAVLVVAILYYFTPNVRQPKFKWTSTGSIIALVVWAVASVAFGFYVSNFGNYNKTYGSLAGIIIFLLWLWITNLALLFGAEWDAELERGRELQAGIHAEENIQLPPRDTALSDKKHAQHEEDVAQGRRLRETHGEDSDPDKAS